MPITELKKGKADLRRSYVINVQVGLIITLLIFIVLFRTNLNFGSDIEFEEQQQQIIEMEDIVQTQHEDVPPPPPRPQPPEQVPDDEIVDDQFFDLASDFDAASGTGDLPPPPQEEEEDDEPEIFMVVEDMPEPVGGMEAIYDALEYPEMARRAGIEGLVTVQFVVDENGNISDMQVLRGIGGGTDQAAFDAIQSVEWNPGRQRGVAVPVRFSLPIRFRLQN